ncbi:MAG: acyltransferase [Acidobacteria bacterium]|nr:acyltransferase [Acidobacteriota bacterium]
MISPGRNFAPIDFKTRFPALDGIRALAVTMVFALHYGGGTHGDRFLSMLNAIRQRGWIGVDIFFVLSGFLITGILYDTRNDSHFFKRFFARRSVRIFPIFYLVFSVLLLLTPLFHYKWRLGHLPYLVYMGNISAAFDDTLGDVISSTHLAASAHIGHFWSLCIEEQFYLIWPLIVWFVRNRVRLIWVASALSIAALVLRIVVALHLSPRLYEQWIVHLLPFRMDDLLVGAILALALRGPSADLFQRSCRWIFLLASAAVVAILIVSPAPDSFWLTTAGLSAIAIAAAGLIGTALRPGGLAFRFFHLRPLRVLGRYSYGFYVYHLIFAGSWWSLVAFLTARFHSFLLANVVSIVLNFGLTFLVSMLSYNRFESRFLHLKERFEYDSELTAR